MTPDLPAQLRELAGALVFSIPFGSKAPLLAEAADELERLRNGWPTDREALLEAMNRADDELPPVDWLVPYTEPWDQRPQGAARPDLDDDDLA